MKHWTLLLYFLRLTVSLALVHAAVIVPGATWTDTGGNVIQAHGGGFLKASPNWSSNIIHGLERTISRLARLITGLAKTKHTIALCLKQFLAIPLVMRLRIAFSFLMI